MIGTKGLSASLWLFFLLLPISFFYHTLFPLPLLVSFLIFKHWLHDLPHAKKNSRDAGLQTITLVPINYLWASFLITLTKETIKKQKCPTFEVHVDLPTTLTGFKTALAMVEKDLLRLKNRTPALFLWETSIPLPRRVRREIFNAQEKGNAFYQEGAFPIPRFPGTQIELKTRRHHGAIYIFEGEDNLDS